jgi:hypothetical protein
VAAAGTLTSALITGIGKATEALIGFANIGKGLGIFAGGLATGVNNPDDPLEVLNASIDRNSAELKAAKAQQETFFGKMGLWVDEDRIKLLENEQRSLQEALRVATQTPDYFFPTGGGAGTSLAPAAGSGDGSNRPFVTPPTEEFEKLRAQLEQQVALYGKTGEAAKIAYEIASGGLSELSTLEGEQLLALAEQYDALVQNSAAAKEFAEQNKQAAEQAAQFRSQLQSQLEDVEQFTMSRTELELAAHAERLEVLRASLEEGLLLEREFHARSIAAAEETQRRITAIVDQEASSRSTSFVDTAEEILDQTLYLTGQLAEHDKAAFNLHKKAAIGKALINTYQGITKTLAEYPGPVGVALALLHGAVGFKQVQAIKATSFGGGAVSSGMTSAGGMPAIRDPSESSRSSASTPEPRQQKIVEIRVMGNVYGSNGIRELIRHVRDQIDDQDVVIIGPHSRQASDLRRDF